MTVCAIPATAVALAVAMEMFPTDVVSLLKTITPVKDVSMALVALSYTAAEIVRVLVRVRSAVELVN
jgi:hypothetical protein